MTGNKMRLILLATAATLIALPAFAQAPTSAQTAADQSLQALLNDVSTIRTASDQATDRDFQDFRNKFASLYQEQVQKAAAQLAAAQKDSDARVAAGKKEADAKIAALTSRMADQHRADQTRIDDLQRQLLHTPKEPTEPPMCINGPMSPKQYQHSEPGHR